MNFDQLLAQARRNLPAIIAVAIIALGALTISITTTDDGGGHRHGTVTVHVDGPDRDAKRDDAIKAPAAAVEEEATSGELEAPLKAGTTPQTHELARKDAPIVGTFGLGASGRQRGCSTHFVRNQSARVTRPRVIVWHYTVSPNLPGTSDLVGLTARANSPSAGVSWHYAIDRPGNCFYNVPEERKAWHVAAGNSLSIGIEVVNTGSEGSYMDPGGYRKLALVTRDAGRRWGIPMQRGVVRNCRVVKPGIVQHLDWGTCGGGHHDIQPYNFAAVLRRVLGSSTGSVLTAIERKIIRGAASPKGSGHSRGYWCGRNRGARAAIHHVAHRHAPPRWKANHRGERYQLLGKSAKKRCRA